MDRKRWAVAPATLVVAACTWLATVGNLALWSELHALGALNGPADWLLAAALAAISGALLVALSSLFAWRGVLKPWLVFLLVAAGIGLHYMLAYHVVIDSTMMVNVAQTDPREVGGLVGWDLLFTLAWSALLPAWLVARAPLGPWPGWRRQAVRNALLAGAALAACAAFLLAQFQPLAGTMRNHKQLRYLLNPLNSLYALAELGTRPLRNPIGPMEPLGRDAQVAGTREKPPMLVLVLGETARSGNFSVNGYARETTPQVAREDIASWRNAWSCGTSTAASLPCMFSHLGRTAFDARRADSENLLDVLQHAGLAVLWVDNQAGCKGLCKRIPNVATTFEKDPVLCAGGECLDAIMLQGLEARVKALPAERRARGVVLVLHQMGSHGPAYSKRSPPEYKRWLPECTSINLQDCGRQDVVNAYDNTIAYTDHVLASTIRWLKAQPAYETAMVYVSDHGESLGENNLYLHGMPYSIAPDVQKRVPWITWLSPAFQARTGITTECLRKRAGEPVSHDHYFHSVLGLMQVQTSAYDGARDAYAPCRAAP
ncbi:phosphoethanolamine transferase [Ramlibacter albus]|uniref:Phosphoethanolamine--lipid A transferase n=1 Tax=Ramlibacter albus TaxID=2079448 RepID=A0A923M8W7_9BURK|nr:phosphoethanolamine--lipid A transferase [Ramlibacter albus]MBC5765041.1 phosphoethanolamine--lipid A transferase [Ramlibacter albus]